MGPFLQDAVRSCGPIARYTPITSLEPQLRPIPGPENHTVLLAPPSTCTGATGRQATTCVPEVCAVWSKRIPLRV